MLKHGLRLHCGFDYQRRLVWALAIILRRTCQVINRKPKGWLKIVSFSTLGNPERASWWRRSQDATNVGATHVWSDCQYKLACHNNGCTWVIPT